MRDLLNKRSYPRDLRSKEYDVAFKMMWYIKPYSEAILKASKKRKEKYNNGVRTRSYKWKYLPAISSLMKYLQEALSLLMKYCAFLKDNS